jgi:hypothetical protein
MSFLWQLMPQLAPGSAVYVTEAFSGQVSKIETNGVRVVIARDLKMPEGIALTPDGKLIVAEVGAKRIVQIDPANGNVTEIAGNLPIGLAAAPGGRRRRRVRHDLLLVRYRKRDLQGDEEVAAPSVRF